jgi:NodT family efflux transporter outer membrane factor (OMF) lipoprotein
MTKKATVTLVALGWLSACASGPDYVAPAIDAPAAYRHAASDAPTGSAPLALDSWWQHFGDPELSRLVALALAQNLDLAAAAERVEQVRAAARLAGTALLPKVEAQAGLAAERQSLESPLGKIASSFPGYDRSPVLRSEALAASWELDLAGGLARTREQRNAEAQAAEAGRLGVRVSLVAEVADSWLRVRGARLRLAIALDNLRADQQLLRLVRDRRDGGLATLGEQAQAEARVAQLKAALPPLRAEIASQLNRIDVLLGVTPGSLAQQGGEPRSEPMPVRPLALPSLGSALQPADLLRRRPDVLAAERRLAASSAAIGAAAAEYYPKLSLSAVLGMESLSTALPRSANFQPGLAAGLRWRLFDFGAVDAQVAGANAAKREALLRYRQAMLRATEEVENALVASNALREEQAALREQLDAAGRARAQAHEAYVGGAASLMDELELDRQVLAARDRLSQAETDSARALVASFRALGGGW